MISKAILTFLVLHFIYFELAHNNRGAHNIVYVHELRVNGLASNQKFGFCAYELFSNHIWFLINS